MKTYLAALALLLLGSSAFAEDLVYEGKWVTEKNRTKQALNGIMTCVVTEVGPEKWEGRFYGVWMGQKFDYPKVKFEGPVDALKGKSMIDGASYDWTGFMTPDTFQVEFDGSRYKGKFELFEKAKK